MNTQSTNLQGISRRSVNKAPRYSQKSDFQYGVRPPSWIWKISIFLSNSHPRNGNLHRHTKFDRNRNSDWDMKIKLFSKWRPSAILNLWKLPFWSTVRYLHVIHLHSEICINRRIWHRYIAKKTVFNMASVRHLEFEKFWFYVKFSCSGWKFVYVYQIWSKSDNSPLRYRDKAIFKMVAIRRPPSWICENCHFGQLSDICTWFISIPKFA